jgi:hypothetical protein
MGLKSFVLFIKLLLLPRIALYIGLVEKYLCITIMLKEEIIKYEPRTYNFTPSA